MHSILGRINKRRLEILIDVDLERVVELFYPPSFRKRYIFPM